MATASTELVGQQARWQEHLQEFDFDIKHRTSHKHLNADALSRRPCGHAECCPPKERNRAAKSEDELEANEGDVDESRTAAEPQTAVILVKGDNTADG